MSTIRLGLTQKFYEIGLVHDGKSASKRFIFGVMDKKLEFSAVRGYLQTIGLEEGFELSLSKKEFAFFDPEISCVVKIDGKERGIFGKMEKKLLERLGLGFDVYLCELRL